MDSGFGPVIERLKAALGLRTDKDVADALGMKASTFGERRKRGTLPFEELLRLADSRNVDLRWLLTGRQGAGAQEPRATYGTPIDVELLTTVIAGLKAELQSRGRQLQPAREAKVIAIVYEHFKAKGGADAAAFSRFLDLVLDG